MANNPVINIDPDGMLSMSWGGLLGGLGGLLNSFTTTSTTQVGGTAKFGPGPLYKTTTTKDFGSVGDFLQLAGGIFSFALGSKRLTDGQFELGFDAITNSTPDPFLGEITYAYNYKVNQIFYYSVSAEWYMEDIGNFIGPRQDIIRGSVSIEYIDTMSEGETAWFNGEVGNMGVYRMTAEEVADFNESQLSCT